MNKKNIKLGKVKVTVGDLPVEYDPFNKGAMEKLAHANKIGLGKVIRKDEDGNKPKSNAGKPSQKSKTNTHSKVTIVQINQCVG